VKIIIKISFEKDGIEFLNEKIFMLALQVNKQGKGVGSFYTESLEVSAYCLGVVLQFLIPYDINLTTT
jgi:hypothetical protein